VLRSLKLQRAHSFPGYFSVKSRSSRSAESSQAVALAAAARAELRALDDVGRDGEPLVAVALVAVEGIVDPVLEMLRQRQN
jgi:hypothetical protein